MFVDMEQDAASSRCSSTRAGANSWSQASTGRASSSTKTTASATPARASRSSTSTRRTRRCAIATVAGDTVAVIGDNRKMVIFPLDQVPEMARGRGVRLQRYKDGGLSDITTFDAKAGLTWRDSAGRESEPDAEGAGRLARQSRRCRPAAAEGLSEVEQVRAGRRVGRGLILPQEAAEWSKTDLSSGGAEPERRLVFMTAARGTFGAPLMGRVIDNHVPVLR